MNPVASTRPHWWQWPTVLSLDAPAVALVWQAELARVARVPLGWQHAAILSVSVWLAYVLDRWIEGWRLTADQVSTPRHQFYKRWRWPVAVLWIVFLCADLAIAWTRLTRREWMAGWLLLAPVVLYLLSHQWIHRHRAWRVPKEVCVAALLGGGVAVFLVAPAPQVVTRVIAMPLGLFILLCFANCSLISLWERDVDEAHGQTSLALQYRDDAPIATLVPWLLAAASAGLLLGTPTPAARSALACCLLSSVLLAAVSNFERRVGWQTARVLADAALMTPLLPLASGWLR